MKRIFFLCCVSLCLMSVQAGLETTIWRTDIKTLTVRYVSDIEASNKTHLKRPFLTLAGTDFVRESVAGTNMTIDGSEPNNTLEISFDELSHDAHMYTYTVRHLNADHEFSNLESYEYLQGFTTADITDYEHSLNTQQAYTHYRFTFPNADMQITRSGNYVILIYEDGKSEEIVAQACFSVVEPLVQMSASITPNTVEEIAGRYQQLEMSVQAAMTNGEPLANCLFAVVRQNGRTDNEVFRPRPTMVESNRLTWHNSRELVFEGGHEYRHFDTWSTYFGGHNVDRIVYDHTDYHAVLSEDEVRGTANNQAGRTGINYMHEFDEDGQFRVNAERVLNDVATEAEYMWVHWTLPMQEPLLEGGIYILGDIFYNRFTAENRMLYDNERRCYYLNALIKQGGYDYLYMLKGKQNATLLKTEGSHWQTGNSYTIYIYYRPVGSRGDRLVGLQTYSSSST